MALLLILWLFNAPNSYIMTTELVIQLIMSNLIGHKNKGGRHLTVSASLIHYKALRGLFPSVVKGSIIFFSADRFFIFGF